MTNPTNTSPRPALLAGRQVPIRDLHWQEFEQFMRAVLVPLEPRTGFVAGQKSTGSGDGGFDVNARRVSDGALVCVPCKRNNSGAFQVPDAAEELAKVAMTSWIEKSDVKEHYVVCTGGVGEKLQAACREEKRTTLLNAAQEKAKSSAGELKTLRESISANGGDAAAIVGNYVGALA